MKKFSLIALSLVLLVSGLVALGQLGQHAAYAGPQPSTPTPHFGPIVDQGYTPPPLHTPFPTDLHPHPCQAIVAAPQVSLYQMPDAASAVTGSAAAGNALVVSQIASDGSGNRWAATAQGWLSLAEGQAALDTVRACDILAGTQPNTTLAGLHVLLWHQHDAVIEFVQRMALSGHPVGTVKGVSGAEQTLAEVKQISPQTVTVYRSILTDQGNISCPDEKNPDPAATARAWLASLETYWGAVSADYYELLNECPGTIAWHTQFAVEAMRVAGEQGRCLLIFTWGVGSPEMDQFDQALPAYQYAAEHPCQSGRRHGIAMHTYSLESDILVSEADKWLAYRHRLVYDALLNLYPPGVDVPVYLTEVGIGWGDVMPTCETVARDVIQYTYELEQDPYIKGFHLWNVGAGTTWIDLSPCLPQIGDALIAYYSTP